MGAITIFLVVLVLLSSVALYRFYRSRNFQRIVLYDYQRGVAYRKGSSTNFWGQALTGQA